MAYVESRIINHIDIKADTDFVVTPNSRIFSKPVRIDSTLPEEFPAGDVYYMAFWSIQSGFAIGTDIVEIADIHKEQTFSFPSDGIYLAEILTRKGGSENIKSGIKKSSVSALYSKPFEISKNQQFDKIDWIENSRHNPSGGCIMTLNKALGQ